MRSTASMDDALRQAAERVVWFDWSDNDEDAVRAIADLRAALEAYDPSSTGEES